MRLLVLGSGGMLGRAVVRDATRLGHDVVARARTDLDITDPDRVSHTVAEIAPRAIVNCAGFTDVDGAEGHEPEATRVNGDGPGNVARAAAEAGSRVVHVSTDYVFDGSKGDPWLESDSVAPLQAYGRTKLAGERAVLNTLPDRGYVVRTAWLYGTGGANFVRTMIRLEGQREKLDVVDDQRGQPTWSADLAGLLLALGRGALAGTAPPGVYHGTSSGETTWYGLTREIFRLLGADPDRVHPTTSEAFVRPAPRPAYSVLGHDRFAAAGVAPLRDWRAALAEAFPRIRRVHEEGDPA